MEPQSESEGEMTDESKRSSQGLRPESEAEGEMDDGSKRSIRGFGPESEAFPGDTPLGWKGLAATDGGYPPR